MRKKTIGKKKKRKNIYRVRERKKCSIKQKKKERIERERSKKTKQQIK